MIESADCSPRRIALVRRALRRASVLAPGSHLMLPPKRETAPCVGVPRVDASPGDAGAWEWQAVFAEGGDVCSLPFQSYSAAERDAQDHARRFLVSSGVSFLSITVRRVLQ